MAAKLQIEFQVSKSGNALEIGDKLSGLLKSKSDQIPPAYMCNKEKLVIIIYEKVDKILKEYISSLNPDKTANIAYISVYGEGGEELTAMSKGLGVNVTGVYNVGVKKGLFGKGKMTEEQLEGAVKFAKDEANKLFESLHL